MYMKGFFFIATISVCIIVSWAKDCEKKCGGSEAFAERLERGESVCVTDGVLYLAIDSCLANCNQDEKSEKIAEDQQQCFCKACSSSEHLHVEYCDNPGPNGTNLKSVDECYKVCNGEAKYYGQLCWLDID